MNMNDWRAIPGFEGRYTVNPIGEVRSVARKIEVRRSGGSIYEKFVPEKTMHQSPDRKGYLMTTLADSTGKKRRHFIHKLVASAFFVGPFRPNPVCRHLDGNKINNRFDNLYIGTTKENISDKAVHGTELYGEQRWNAKLTERDIAEIFRLNKKDGVTQREISRRFGVSPATVCCVLKGKRWSKLTREERLL